MTEDYLHYCWKYKLFDHNLLKTTNGEKIDIIDNGYHNHDSGPDFSEAKIRIGDTVWAGNIEIHINSSDWEKHKHHNDKSYDSVILHVVYYHDKEIKLSKGSILPVLELKNRLDHLKYEKYRNFLFSSLPCINLIQDVPSIIISSTLDSLLIERLIQKTELIKLQLNQNNFNWNQVFFQQLAKSMGLKVNADSMNEMAKNTSVLLFDKLGDNKLAVESILFGQAGLLDDDRLEGDYYKSLKKEYEFHKLKNNLISISKQNWKFSKMRPSNFPTIRLAQLALLLTSNSLFFDEIVNKDISIEKIYKMLECKILDGFWYTHYTFEKESKATQKSIGKTLVDSIIINTISPFLYIYGKYKDDEIYINKAIELLEKLPAENNKITRFFENKVDVKSAANSQGLIHCYKEYCLEKKCLNCSIGIHILKNNK